MSDQKNLDITQLYLEGIWVEESTGLMWSRLSLGQFWHKGKVVGCADQFLLFPDHLLRETIANFGLAGFNDWRLPTLNELQSLMRDQGAGYQCPKEALFPPNKEIWGCYWSSSLCGYDEAYYVNFDGGLSGEYFKNTGNFIRLVR